MVTAEEFKRLKAFSEQQQVNQDFERERKSQLPKEIEARKSFEALRLSGLAQSQQEKDQQRQFFSEYGDVRKQYLQAREKERSEKKSLYQQYLSDRRIFDSQKLQRPISEELELGLLDQRPRIRPQNRRYFESTGNSFPNTFTGGKSPTPSPPGAGAIPSGGFSPAPSRPPGSQGDFYDANSGNFPPPPPAPMPFDNSQDFDNPPPPPPSLYDDDF